MNSSNYKLLKSFREAHWQFPLLPPKIYFENFEYFIAPSQLGFKSSPMLPHHFVLYPPLHLTRCTANQFRKKNIPSQSSFSAFSPTMAFHPNTDQTLQDQFICKFLPLSASPPRPLGEILLSLCISSLAYLISTWWCAVPRCSTGKAVPCLVAVLAVVAATVAARQTQH